MNLKTVLSDQTYSFRSLKEVMGKANVEKSGDILAGVAAEDGKERIAAQDVLANVLLSDLRNEPAVDYDQDEVTRIIQDQVNEPMYNKIKNWPVGQLREWILDLKTTEEEIKHASMGMTSEMIAAVTKLMSNLDLIYAANKIRIQSHCNTTLGERGIFSSRLQPNHTSDNPRGIAASLFEGLSYGVGDALIGLNPVHDTIASAAEVLKTFDEIKNKYEIPTQTCVLAHVNTQIEAIRKGAPSDLIFQSIAGSEKGNQAFGFTSETLHEATALLKQRGTGRGPNVMYFETGQGSELSSEANYGYDQLTMEARCYGYAKAFNPFIVNTVVGFIGPEYLYDSKQVIRAGLEDHFMGKLTGLPMGCDCCYTNHMKADQNDIENLSILLASAGCVYIIGVPAGDDVMLSYQTNSFHDIAAIREILNLRPTKEFERWLEGYGILKDGRLTALAGDPTIFTKKKGVGL